MNLTYGCLDAGSNNDTLATEAPSNLYSQHISNPSSQDKDTGISQNDNSDASLAAKVRTAAHASPLLLI